VTLPQGAHPAIEDRDFTVATLVAPSALRSEGAADEDAGEDSAEG
jgi:large subunit ribosomal protein L25